MVAESLSSWPPAWIERGWVRRAVLVAVACAPGALALLAEGLRGRPLGDAALYALVVTPPLLVRGRWPLPAFAAVLAVAAVAGPTATLAVMLAAYGVGLACSRAAALVAVLVATAALTAVSGLDDARDLADWALTHLVLVGGAAGAGVWQRSRVAYLAHLRDHAARLEREQELLAGRAVAQERVRIARELHDAVGHSVSLMVVQAQAQAVAGGGDARDRAALHALADTGRRAMTELHRMLGVLRIDGRDGDAADRAPQPGIADLDALLADARTGGVDARLVVEGERRSLPDSVELSAYRIVQEALTNVARHARGAVAEVVVRYAPAELELRVEDDGGAAAAPVAAHANGAVPAGGHGLVGMRERVALFGGTLDAGPRDDAPGFAVRATLPLGEDP